MDTCGDKLFESGARRMCSRKLNSSFITAWYLCRWRLEISLCDIFAAKYGRNAYRKGFSRYRQGGAMHERIKVAFIGHLGHHERHRVSAFL